MHEETNECDVLGHASIELMIQRRMMYFEGAIQRSIIPLADSVGSYQGWPTDGLVINNFISST